MARSSNLYDVCDEAILSGETTTDPGRNLRLTYKTVAGNLLLKFFLLKGSRHPAIGPGELEECRAMMRTAMGATVEDWQNSAWIAETFAPLARLLDAVNNPRWQQREAVRPDPGRRAQPSELERVIKATARDVFRIWDRDRKNPYLPVGAQMVLSGDDNMDGANLVDVLSGLGAFEYQNITVLFSLMRCFIMADPGKRSLMRKPYRGVAETMRRPRTWLTHRTAFYDAFFFDHLANYLCHGDLEGAESARVAAIMENIVRFIVVDSSEWLTTPNQAIVFPAITCLPMGEGDQPLCRLSKKNWESKRMLGFGDYVPDTDTTFIGLAVAQKWLDLAGENGVNSDPQLLAECESFLNHPWVEIIHELQVGGRHNSNPPTIHITKPLDYFGAVPIWFDKPITRADGRVVREITGNEICPCHNMDILESILINRRRWRALEGDNLEVVRRFLEFHHRAYMSGNFKRETALKYYLPEIYTLYTGRMYSVYLGLDKDERKAFDPEGKVEEIRGVALDYLKNELVAYTLNPFDAALAVSALVSLGYPSKGDGVIETALAVITDALGEGGRGHPFKAYEWNRMRHPTRIVVGSEVSTSLFVLGACLDAKRYL